MLVRGLDLVRPSTDWASLRLSNSGRVARVAITVVSCRAVAILAIIAVWVARASTRQTVVARSARSHHRLTRCAVLLASVASRARITVIETRATSLVIVGAGWAGRGLIIDPAAIVGTGRIGGLRLLHPVVV